VTSACISLDPCADAEEAEARAVLAGLKFCSNLRSTKVIMELDSLNTVHALKYNHTDRSSLWWIHDETKGLLNSFQEFKISHVKREGNRVADALAAKQF
jgi:ribonuclease HI